MTIHIDNRFSVFGTIVQFAARRTAAGLKDEVAKATLDFGKHRIPAVTGVKLSQHIDP